LSRRQRVVLILGCVLVGALEAPRALRGVSEAVRGPYDMGVKAADAGPVGGVSPVLAHLSSTR